MARQGPKTSLLQREQILARSRAGESAPQIAAALGTSVHTVRKWRRLARQGVSLSPRIGRAPVGALGTFPPALAAAIRQLRIDHPGWGPITLLLELRRDPYWSTQPLPDRSRVAAFLKDAGLTRRYGKQRPPPTPPREPPEQPHDCWQLDAQAETLVGGLGSVSIINIVDVLSRLKVESYPALGKSQPDTADYQAALRTAFIGSGLPGQLSLDHGSAFIDNTTPSPFPTLLHLWLIGLGIDVFFTRKRCPTDHGIVERTHQTITQQALVGQHYDSPLALYAGLATRRRVLNEEFPTRSLGKRAPLQVYPVAAQIVRPYRPEWEAKMLDLGRVEQYLAQGEWFRQTNVHGEFWLGQQRYNAGRRWGKHEMAIHFEAESRELVMRPAGSGEELRRAIKGLNAETLMGHGASKMGMPPYQMALPLAVQAHGPALRRIA